MKKLFFTQYFRPFAITIRPNDQLLTRSNLAHQLHLYVLVIFGRYFVQRCVKLLDGLTRVPLLKVGREFERKQVTRHGRHYHLTALIEYVQLEFVDLIKS